jgi:aminoglycoside phosphotransferase (APT) family kinase protein
VRSPSQILVVEVGTAILARIWASRNFGGPKSAVACAAVGAIVRDPEITATQLSKWLTDVAGLADVSVDHIEIPSATGWSNETILFDGTWSEGGGEPVTHHLVARIAPQAYTVFLEANFESQFRVMQALADHTDVPMPEMLWFEPDPTRFGSPFWIMARVDGIAPADAPHYSVEGWLRDATADEQATIWWNGIAALAAVHNLDWRALGLDRLDDAGRGEPALEQQLTYSAESLEWAEQGTPHPGARAALAWLQAHRPASDPARVTITWGDSRLANQMFREGDVVAGGDGRTLGGAHQPQRCRPPLVPGVRGAALHRRDAAARPAAARDGRDPRTVRLRQRHLPRARPVDARGLTQGVMATRATGSAAT